MAMVCGICADDLCENHKRDCVFDGTFLETLGGPCACPSKDNEQPIGEQ